MKSSRLVIPDTRCRCSYVCPSMSTDKTLRLSKSIGYNTNLRVVVATTREIAQQTASASNGCMGLPT